MEVNIQKKMARRQLHLRACRKAPLLNHRKNYKGSKKRGGKLLHQKVPLHSHIRFLQQAHIHTKGSRRDQKINLKKSKEGTWWISKANTKNAQMALNKIPPPLVNFTKNLHMLNLRLLPQNGLSTSLCKTYIQKTSQYRCNHLVFTKNQTIIKLYIKPPKKNSTNLPAFMSTQTQASMVAFMATALRWLRKERRPAAKETASVSKKRSAGNGKFPTKWAPKLYMELKPL